MTDRYKTALLIAAVLSSAACREVAEPAKLPSDPQLWVLRMTTPASETGSPTLLGEGAGFSHRELLQALHDAAQDDKVRGVLLHIGQMGDAFARVADVSEALGAVREAQKPVHCYLEFADNFGYALAAAGCDRISMTPGGTLNLVGIASQAIYAQELLQTLGLTAELLQVGRYKGVADSFTRDSMPEEVRQNLGEMLDDLQASLISAVAQGRELDDDRVRAMIDRGPLTPHAARQAGLLDDVGFDDEALAHAKRAAKVDRVVKRRLKREQKDSGLFELIRALTGDVETDSASGERLVIAYLDGVIARGSGETVQSSEASAFVPAMRDFADDDEVKAIVLRIDSPGGSALASDLMWHAVRRAAKRKPVIVSIGDMAASGGYYVACAGSEVLARETSLIGSIGVVGGKVVVEDLAERAGVEVTTLKRGAHAGWMSSARRFSEGEREAFERSLRSAYRLFLRRIAQGRGMQAERIEAVAEGRLMTGSRAREGGLIDRFGGLDAAIALARERGKLEDDTQVQVWPPRRTLLEQIAELSSQAEAHIALLHRALAGTGLRRAALLELWLAGETGPIAALPFALQIR